MAYSKAYTPTDWVNSPSTSTPINATNLDHIEDGIDTLDDRIVDLDTRTLYGTSNTGITSYPTAVGVYRVTGTRPTGLPDLASLYGELIIYGNGYFTHIYHGNAGDVWIGRSTDSVSAPSSWRQLQTSFAVARSETDLDDITDIGFWRLGVTPTANYPTFPVSTSGVNEGSPFAHAFLEVIANTTGNLLQRLTTINLSAYSLYANRTWQRVYQNSTWSDWTQVLTGTAFRSTGSFDFTINLDNFTTPGIYPGTIGTLSTNTPGFGAWIVNFAQGTDSLTQVAIGTLGAKIAIRYYNSSSSTWSSWKSVTLS